VGGRGSSTAAEAGRVTSGAGRRESRLAAAANLPHTQRERAENQQAGPLHHAGRGSVKALLVGGG
jgi:hypothetical protein